MATKRNPYTAPRRLGGLAKVYRVIRILLTVSWFVIGFGLGIVSVRKVLAAIFWVANVAMLNGV